MGPTVGYMPDSAKIMLHARPGRGLYESFYYRGTSPDGSRAFWLKHNMLRYRGSDDVWLEAAMVLFDRRGNRTHTVHASRALDRGQFERLMAVARDWEHVQVEFEDGTFVEISPRHLRGRISGEGGQAAWDLKLHPSGLRLLHFPHEALYSLPWPKKKLVTRDCHLGFSGNVAAGAMAFDGAFLGMNGHNWGSEHAHTYAYANCTQFHGRGDAYFDGFSVRLAVAGDLAATPCLSMASLHAKGRWHHFNSLLRAPVQKVLGLSDYAWQVDLVNRTHRLEVRADGASPAARPWVALHYEHPSRKRSVVRNTKFASLRLRLVRLADGVVEEELASEACELETLLPRNKPASDGYVGQA